MSLVFASVRGLLTLCKNQKNKHGKVPLLVAYDSDMEVCQNWLDGYLSQHIRHCSRNLELSYHQLALNGAAQCWKIYCLMRKQVSTQQERSIDCDQDRNKAKEREAVCIYS